MKEGIQKKRNEFVQQFQAVAQNIQALSNQLENEKKHLEQLRGAVAALDQLEASLNEPAKTEAKEAKVADETKAAESATAEQATEKGASDGQEKSA